MSPGRLTIDGTEVSLGAVWVHWKTGRDRGPHTFQLLVRGEVIPEVFDRWKQKPPSERWDNFILAHLRESGTPAFQSYLDSLLKLGNVQCGTWEWVLTGVDSVSLTEKGILLGGSAEKFDLRRIPVLKSLE